MVERNVKNTMGQKRFIAVAETMVDASIAGAIGYTNLILN